MFHTDSSLNRRADGNKTLLVNENSFQQNNCLFLDSC